MTSENEEQYGVPESMRVKRKYTMSDEAMEARRQNAQKSTGPKTAEGKAVCSKNSWKHGGYAQSFILGKLGKPCHTTCDRYPCSLVDDGEVRPGQTCLDKAHVAESFEAIIKAIESKGKDCGDFNSLAALEMAGALQILRDAKAAILEDGIILKSAKIDKDGNVIGHEYVQHPAWGLYCKMLTDLGLTFQDFAMTPKEIAKAEKGATEEEMETAATLMSRVIKNMAKD